MKKVFSLLLVLLSVATFAQNKGSVKGVVYDKTNGEAIAFATVKVDSSEFGASTDDKGYFSIPNLPVGTYTLIINYVGYEAQRVAVEIRKGITSNIKIFLSTKSVELQGVEINADKEKRETETGV